MKAWHLRRLASSFLLAAMRASGLHAQAPAVVPAPVTFVALTVRVSPGLASDSALLRRTIEVGINTGGAVKVAEYAADPEYLAYADPGALVLPQTSLIISATLGDSMGTRVLRLRASSIESGTTLLKSSYPISALQSDVDEGLKAGMRFSRDLAAKLKAALPARFSLSTDGRFVMDSSAYRILIQSALEMSGKVRMLRAPDTTKLRAETGSTRVLPVSARAFLHAALRDSADRVWLVMKAVNVETGVTSLERTYGLSSFAAAPEELQDSASTFVGAWLSRTQVVMLGTGTPIPDPDRAGPGVAIVVDSVAYLFDAGAGVVRRAAAAGRNGIGAFAARVAGGQPSPRFEKLFLTHLHSDHTLGLADVIFTPWIQGRAAPLDIYGPPGTKRLADGILDGNAEDIAERVKSSGGPSANGWKAVVHEIAPGEVYRDARIVVTSFAVPHSQWKHAFGYRIQTPDRVIVLSGDARPNSAVAAQCNGCDVLIHEVYSTSGFATVPPARQSYHAQAHTSAAELGDLATQAKPGLLVLYHQLFFGASEETLLTEVRSRFRGKVVSAHDLDVY